MPVHSMDSDGRLPSDEYGTTDEEVMDKSGGACASHSTVPQQPQTVPSDPARLAAEAVMRTTFPTMIAEMNPDWEPLTQKTFYMTQIIRQNQWTC